MEETSTESGEKGAGYGRQSGLQPPSGDLRTLPGSGDCPGHPISRSYSRLITVSI